jgi:hypothetical protein
MYITAIDSTIEGDTTFPLYNPFEWTVIAKIERESDEKNIHKLTFLTLEKIQQNEIRYS